MESFILGYKEPINAMRKRNTEFYPSTRSLFKYCDAEKKGYITSEDIRALQDVLPITANQLDKVFATLDEDEDDRLCLEEFSDGFGMFLEIHANNRERKLYRKSPLNRTLLSPITERKNDTFEVDHLDSRHALFSCTNWQTDKLEDTDSSSTHLEVKNFQSFQEVAWKVSCLWDKLDDPETKPHWKVKVKLNMVPSKTVQPLQVKKTLCSTRMIPIMAMVDFSSHSERVFKVVLVGDSGVGKTTFIHRFCNGSFISDIHSTIGMDFQTRAVTVNGRRTLFQLWDTAGQERFRSISKHYYRNADAVVAMYDVTKEQSFRNIRAWIHNSKDYVQDGIILLLLGNKTDARSFTENDIVRSINGAQLAEDCQALFFETSVKEDLNVYDAMTALASVLQEKADRDIQDIVNLKDALLKRKSRC